MPRIARAVAVGHPHHITQRGNYRQPVFSGDEDYRRYLEWLGEYARQYAVRIWAYCLMDNHVHFVAVPLEEESFSKAFKLLHMRYSRYFNDRIGAVGHLWQGRYYSCVLDERHLYAAVRYVEMNPVRAGIVSLAEEYQWSSAAAHVAGGTDTPLSEDCPLLDGISDWTAYLREGQDTAMVDAIRESTRTGKPCGTADFRERMGALLGRRFAGPKRGRPRNERK
jgi:putative transposase